MGFIGIPARSCCFGGVCCSLLCMFFVRAGVRTKIDRRSVSDIILRSGELLPYHYCFPVKVVSCVVPLHSGFDTGT